MAQTPGTDEGTADILRLTCLAVSVWLRRRTFGFRIFISCLHKFLV